MIVPQKDIPKEFFDLIAMGMSTVNLIWFRGKSLAQEKQNSKS